MSLTNAENYKFSSRDTSEEAKRGVKPRESSGGGAGEEGCLRGDNSSSEKREWKDSPYTEDSLYIDR